VNKPLGCMSVRKVVFVGFSPGTFKS